MKRVMVCLLLGALARAAAADFDPARVVGITINLGSAPGVEISPFPLILGESTFPSVTLTLDDGTLFPLPPEEVTLTSQNTNIVQAGPGNQIKAVGVGSTSVSFQFYYWIQQRTIAAVMPPARIVHRYSFDDLDPALAFDSVGSAHGWLTNDLPGGAIPSLINGEARFDGQGGYIGLPPGIASTFTNLSLATWIVTNNTHGTRTNPAVTTRLLDFSSRNTDSGERTGGLALEIDPVGLRGFWGGLTQEVWSSWWPFGNYPTGLVTAVVAPSPVTLFGRLPGAQAPKGLTNLPALEFLADTDNRIGGSLASGYSFNGTLAEVRLYEGLLSAYDLELMRQAGPDTLLNSFGDLRRIRVILTPSMLELSNPQPATVQVFGDFTGPTNVDLLASGHVGLALNPGSPLALQGSNLLNLVRFPGPASLNINSLITSKTIAGVPVPIAGPQQLRLVLPATSFSVRNAPVGFSVAGDFLYAANIDLTQYGGTRLTVSDPGVVQLLPGPKLEFLKAGTAWLRASLQDTPNAATELQITVTNPPGFAASSPRLLYRWDFSDVEWTHYTYDLVRHALLAGRTICKRSGIYVVPYGDPPTFEGTYAHLNGYSSFFDMSYGLMALTNCTLEMWVRPHYTRSYQRLFNLYQPLDPYNVSPLLGDSQPLAGDTLLAPASDGGSGGVLARFAPANVDTNQFYSLQGPTALPADSWSHLVWVHSPSLGVGELYLNGVQVAAAQTTAAFWPPVGRAYSWLGRTAGDPNRFFYGDYDEFRVYDGALTPAEVRLNYLAGPNSPPARPLALGSPLRTRPASDPFHFKIGVPNPSTEILLESSPSLGPNAIWTQVDAPRTTESDGTTTVELPIQTIRFFRLRFTP